MRIAIDGESPIVGDERFSSPRVPPKHTVLPRQRVPARPHEALSRAARGRRCDAALRIGSVGEYRAKGGNRWDCYCLGSGRSGTSCERSPRRARRPSAYWGNS